MDPAIGLCTGVSSLCLEYVKRYKNAPTELRTIVIEVDAVKSVLGLLNAFPKDDDDTTCILARLVNTVTECERVLRSLAALLSLEEDHGDEDQDGKRRKLKDALNRGEWPFKRQKISKILEELSRVKSTLTLGLTVDSANDLKQIRNNVRNIKENTDAAELDRILDWLVTTDPSPIHNDACNLHEKHTGEWLINSPDYRDWREGRNRILWIHGIAGAGKTNLLAHIFEDVKSFCDTIALKGTGFAYYYCYFARAQNEATHILRWIISQLCRQIEGLPADVRSLWREGTEPSIQELIDAIFQILPNFPRVYITIDALDESEKRDEFLAFINKLFSDERLAKISFLVTSRHEKGIENVLSRHNRGLSMSNPYVNEDIRVYVRACIGKERRMKIWPEDLKQEVEVALVEQAQGMFRWVVCQLDNLKWLGNPDEIRSATLELPETLYETYEQVLRGIPNKCKEKVFRAFKLIASASGTDSFTVDQLAVALAVDIQTQTYSAADLDLDKWAVVEFCKCLVAVDPISEKVRFAHNTVWEYLSSSRLKENSSVQEFFMTRDSVRLTAAMCSIIIILEDKLDDENQYLHFAHHWEVNVTSIHDESIRKQITPLVLKLLDLKRPHFLRLMKTRSFPTKSRSWKEPILKAHRSNKLGVTFAYLIYLFLFDFAKDLVVQGLVTREVCGKAIYQQYAEQSVADPSVLSKLWAQTKGFPTVKQSEPFGLVGATNVFEIVCGDPRGDDFLSMLLALGADPSAVSEAGFSCLSAALLNKGHRIPAGVERAADKAELLLRAGARVCLPHLSVTPLQCMFVTAVRSSFKKIEPINSIFPLIQRMFDELVDRGADVNSVGTDQANMKRIKITYEAHFSTNAWTYDPSNCPERILKEALNQRGDSSIYETPLRILENAIHPRNERLIRGEVQRHKEFCQTLIDFLKSRGAKSLHLFPHPGLPGYCAEDMAEWQRLKDSGELQGRRLKLTGFLKDFIYSVWSKQSNAYGRYWRSKFVFEQRYKDFGLAKWAVCIGVLLFAAMIWQTTNLRHRIKDEL